MTGAPPADPPPPTTHVAGAVVTMGAQNERVIQRCAVCGCLLVDLYLSRTDGKRDEVVPQFPVRHFVRVWYGVVRFCEVLGDFGDESVELPADFCLPVEEVR